MKHVYTMIGSYVIIILIALFVLVGCDCNSEPERPWTFEGQEGISARYDLNERYYGMQAYTIGFDDHDYVIMFIEHNSDDMFVEHSRDCNKCRGENVREQN